MTFLKNKQNVFKFLFLLFVFSIPFGTKKFLFSFTMGVSELTSAFLYGTDILLVLFLAFFFFSGSVKYSNVLKNIGIDKRLLFLAVFVLFAFFSIFFASYKPLALYQFIRLASLALAALAIGFLLKEGFVKLKHIFFVIAASAVLQSMLGFFQFILGKSVGFFYLGETVIEKSTDIIARVSVDGARLLRAYGTMPHANILAGFLVLGLLAVFYLLVDGNSRSSESVCSSNTRILQNALFSSAIFIIFLGIMLTFSRSGWIVAIAAVLLFLTWIFLNKEHRKSAFDLIIVITVSLSLLFSALGWAIFPRAKLSFSEPSVNYRILYNKIGIQLISESPLGVGIGNQTLVSKDKGMYQSLGIAKPSDWQPVHNIYLLMASEVGALGLISFLVFLYYLVFKNPKSQTLNSKQITNSKFKIQNTCDFNHGISTIMLLALLLFGLFDHFLWTLQSGWLMLWIVLGLVLGLGAGNNNNEGASPHSLKDKA